MEGGSAEERLKSLGIVLPTATKPLAVYLPIVVVDGIAYVSGHPPKTNEGALLTGKVGKDRSIEEGYQAARACVSL